MGDEEKFSSSEVPVKACELGFQQDMQSNQDNISSLRSC